MSRARRLPGPAGGGADPGEPGSRAGAGPQASVRLLHVFIPQPRNVGLEAKRRGTVDLSERKNAVFHNSLIGFYALYCIQAAGTEMDAWNFIEDGKCSSDV